MKNSKGMSLIGLLLAALIIAMLLKLAIAPYKQMAKTNQQPGQPPHIQTQSQAKQMLDNVRAQLQEVQKTTNERANFDPGRPTRK